MPTLFLGVDVGTYSAKGVVTNSAGQVLATHVVAHDISMPAPGHVEHDAETIWWAETATIIRALLQHIDTQGFSAKDIAAIAVSAIGPCLLPLDAQGQALRPGILYGVDTRAQRQTTTLEHDIGATNIFAHSQMALTSQAVGPKIVWLREHEPEIWQRTRTLTTASSYITFRLTGQHVMDHHTASHYMPLYDPARADWSDQFAPAVLGDRGLGLLPRLAYSNETCGHVTPLAAAQTGLLAGTPVAVGAVDALSEAISVGAVHPGDLMVMYGSTTFFILVQDHPTPDPRVWTVRGAFAGQHNLAAGMGTTGSLTRWFKDELAQDLNEDAYAQLFEAAANVPRGANGLLLLPYFSGERTPINDPQAKGILAGLTLGHTRNDIFRAVLEGVAFGVRDNLETFAAMGAKIKRIIAVGGGATSRTWPQIISDVANTTQLLPKITVGASYGNAFLAGMAVGAHGLNALEQWVQFETPIVPQPNAVYDQRFELYKQLYANTKALMHALSR